MFINKSYVADFIKENPEYGVESWSIEQGSFRADIAIHFNFRDREKITLFVDQATIFQTDGADFDEIFKKGLKDGLDSKMKFISDLSKKKQS